MIERHIQTIFCDDIRHEIGGKLSYIGTYSSAMYVNKFPATLPKLALSVIVITPADKPFLSMTLRVFKDSEILQEIMLDDEQIKEASILVDDIPDEVIQDRVLQARLLLMFSPLYLDKPCKLRVRVQNESDELRGMALQIEQAPAEEDVASQ